jgi:hypothetical protein
MASIDNTEEIELQKKNATTKAAIWDGHNTLKDFLGVVEYNFTLWNHLQNP